MIDLKGKTVFVTGGSSMLGSAAVELLREGKSQVISPSHTTCDLRFIGGIRHQLNKHKPDYMINFCGFNGSINFNAQFPADIYHKNATMALNVLYAAHENNVKKVVNILPSCAYACDYDNGDPREELFSGYFLDGRPHKSVECHGFSKRVFYEYSMQLHKQFGFNSVCCVINNSFGPKDSFDVNKTKVIGAMIRKFVDATKDNSPYVQCFGTGKPRREFIYSADAAQGVIKTLEFYNDPMLVLNIGNGKDISIKELAELIKKLTGFRGEIVWLTEKPDGQMVKLLNNSMMKEIFNGWVPPTDLEEGLTKTIQWYRENYVENNR